MNNSRLAIEHRQKGDLTTDEIADSEIELIRIAQRGSFVIEYKSLAKGNGISSNSKIISLNPHLDEEGLICAYG